MIVPNATPNTTRCRIVEDIWLDALEELICVDAAVALDTLDDEAASELNVEEVSGKIRIPGPR